ncbi:MAG: prolipoprotein diacylglyceryl transferase [Cytophagales bacterium]|nr:prolipoprotein diacylglyceryl transferase [Cytophagales bacterium]
MFSFVFSAVVWDVSPEIFHLKIWDTTVSVAWYGLLFAISFIVGQRLLFHIFRREGKPATDVDLLTIYAVVAAVIGARLGHFVFYEWETLLTDPWHWFRTLVTPPFRGLASHGGTVGILVALYWYARQKTDQSFLWVTDRVVIPVSLGAALIRLGNLFNSEIYGKPTDLPWGFLFVQETDPRLLPVVPRHPTQLYEAFFYLFLLALTFSLWKHKREQLSEGFLTGLFLTLLFTFRFLVEFLKNDQAAFEASLSLNMGQILSIPAVLAGVMLLITARHNRSFTKPPQSSFGSLIA